MKKRIRLFAAWMALVMALMLLAACGSSDQPTTDPQPTQSQPAESQPVESEPVVSEEPEPEVPQVEQDLAEYLWEIPEDATVEEKARLELRNASLITAMEPIFEEESYSAYSKAVTSLKSKKMEDRLAKALEARANLVQSSSVADGVYFLWNDFDSMPIADGESYTEEQLDAASLLGYGYTTVMVKYLLDDPTTAKGNIVVVSGGAMKGRSNGSEGYPAVEVFNELGYNCFLVQRRVEPYSTMDIYMDYQRAVRTVRYYAALEGWGGQDMIAGLGWSGGGATILGAIRSCYGALTPAAYDSDYIPDEIDAVSSDLDAALIIYGAYNHEGGGLLDTINSNLPAFYINHGTADATIPYENAQELYDLVVARNVPAQLTLIEGANHGYGVGTVGTDLPEGCSTWMAEADAFMQANLGHSEDNDQINVGPAIMFDEKAEAPDLTGKKVIACIGDSITAGGYPNELQVLVDAQYEDHVVYNFGEPGAILTSGDRFTYTDLDAFAASIDVKADVYIIMFGTNDTQKRLTVDEASIREVYGNLMDAYMNANPEAEIYIMLSPYLYPEPGKDTIKFDLQLDVLENLVLPIVTELANDRNLTIINVHEFTANHAEWFADGVHPNADGAKKLAAYVFENISGSLK